MSGPISELVAPKPWLAALQIFGAALFAAASIQMLGGRVGAYLVAGLLLGLGIASLAVSKGFSIDIIFAPMATAAIMAALAAQIAGVLAIDSYLTASIRRVVSDVSQIEGREARSRLLSGLRLLQTVLPVSEAVVFHPNEDGQLDMAARLRSNQIATALDCDQNSTWREGVALCERAFRTRRILATEGQVGSPAIVASVAIPLEHEGRSVGALLLRLKEHFSEEDRPLLTAVAAQLARNFQRDEARADALRASWQSMMFKSAAEQRLEEFRAISGLLTEQRFGAEVLFEVSDAHAVAYLDGTLAYVNPTMSALASIDQKDTAHWDLFSLLGKFRGGVFDEPSIAVRRVLQSSQPYEREIYYPDRNQTLEIRIALAKTRSQTGGEEPLCLSIRVRDVTQTKEYEKLKSDMISLMSHELRTPITSINGFAELLAADESLPAESREFLTIISNESQRLSRMINTFLTVAQLQSADKQAVLKIPLKLDDIVKESIANLQPLAKRKRIRLVVQPNGTLPPVAADKSLITQVITNLVDNAIKYSPDRTTVTVSTALETDAVRVSVEDRGYGIPPEAVDRIWEKFYRVARDGQEKHEESTGLGLAFVKEVIDQHGGTVGIDSEVGKGSTFSFTLPRL